MALLKKILKNQALGLLPLLVALICDGVYSYKVAFIVGMALCMLGFLLLYIFRKQHIYQFLLIPTTLTLILYSVFLFFDLQPLLYAFSILIAEILLVVVLAISGFFKRTILAKIRNSAMSAYQRTTLRLAVNEAYFIAQITQNLYTLHLFTILMYIHFPQSVRSTGLEYFFYQHLGTILAIGIIIYGQIRTQLMYGGLKKEVWLPVLNDKGRVIGSIARSVSHSSKKKFYHPVIRVAVVYKGMLYLQRRSKNEFISPDMLDYPLFRYIRLHQTLEDALHQTLGALACDECVTPRMMLRYTFENDSVKHLVHLYAVTLHNEEQLKTFTNGKLWTSKQIEENMGKNLFSECFEKEFPYLQSTVLLAENIGSGCS